MKKTKFVKKTFSMPESFYKWLETKAKKENYSKSAIIQDYIRQDMKNGRS